MKNEITHIPLPKELKIFMIVFAVVFLSLLGVFVYTVANKQMNAKQMPAQYIRKEKRFIPFDSLPVNKIKSRFGSRHFWFYRSQIIFK